MSDWWRKGTFYPEYKSNYPKIISFYLFNCPVQTFTYEKIDKTKKKGKDNRRKVFKKVSQTNDTFESRNWVKGNLITLQNAMKGNIPFIFVESTDNVEEKHRNLEASSSNSDKNYEYVIFKKSGELSQTVSIFYHIRNAIAHGSFSVVRNNDTPIYYFQSQKDGDIKSRIRLKENTLLQWIDFFNSNVSEIKEMKQAKKSKKKVKNK